MRLTFAALSVALALTAPSPAFSKEEAPKTSFTYEGVTYIYSTTKVGKSTTIYQGHAEPGQKFRLVRNGNRVFGEANGMDVSFRMDEIKRPISVNLTLALR